MIHKKMINKIMINKKIINKIKIKMNNKIYIQVFKNQIYLINIVIRNQMIKIMKK